MQPWIEKHKPASLQDIVGHDQAKQQLKDFVDHYKQQKKRALLLYGPTGTGKSSAVHALAQQEGLELLEINASDTRNAAAIEHILGNAVKQQSLFFTGKIILVDEADGLSGTKDRGGLQAVIKLIEQSAFPVIITLQNPYDRKFNALRKKCVLVEFGSVSAETLASHLKSIAHNEHIDAEQAALDQLSRMADGDVRAAINDLQLLSTSGSVTLAALDEYFQRERQEQIQQALFKVFKSKNLDVVLPAFDHVPEDLDKIFLWMDENLPREYRSPEALAKAYDAVSLADVFFGRIRRWQHYRFYVYCYALLSAGVALAKDAKNPERLDYKETTRLLKIWMARQKRLKQESIAQKLADTTHTSKRRAFTDVLFLKHLFSNDPDAGEAIADELELSNEETAWLEA